MRFNHMRNSMGLFGPDSNKYVSGSKTNIFLQTGLLEDIASTLYQLSNMLFWVVSHQARSSLYN